MASFPLEPILNPVVVHFAPAAKGSAVPNREFQDDTRTGLLLQFSMSILSHKHRFLFVHVAKTGGRSINLTLRKRCPRSERFNTHKLNSQVDVLGRRIALEIKPQTTPEQWHSYFKFAFVRNPWDRTVSMFRHVQSAREMNSKDKLRYLQEITRRLKIRPDEFTFEVFVKSVLRDRVFDNYHWDKQIHCFTDQDNRNLFDFIGRFENLQQDFDFVCRRINFPQQRLPHHHKSRHDHYSAYYTKETEQIVGDLYREDVETFGYECERRPVAPHLNPLHRVDRGQDVGSRQCERGKKSIRKLFSVFRSAKDERHA